MCVWLERAHAVTTPPATRALSGWGGTSLARYIDTKKYDLTVISSRNHMVFTPLLVRVALQRGRRGPPPT